MGKLVHDCVESGKTLETLTLSEYQAVCPLFSEDVFEAIDLMTCLNGRMVPGGPAPQMVKNHIDQVREYLKEVHA